MKPALMLIHFADDIRHLIQTYGETRVSDRVLRRMLASGEQPSAAAMERWAAEQGFSVRFDKEMNDWWFSLAPDHSQAEYRSPGEMKMSEAKTLTICSECVNCIPAVAIGRMHPDNARCGVSRSGFVSNGRQSFHFCGDINTAGDCLKFDAGASDYKSIAARVDKEMRERAAANAKPSLRRRLADRIESFRNRRLKL